MQEKVQVINFKVKNIELNIDKKWEKCYHATKVKNIELKKEV